MYIVTVGATLAVARIPAARPPAWMCTGRVQDPPLRYILTHTNRLFKVDS